MIRLIVIAAVVFTSPATGAEFTAEDLAVEARIERRGDFIGFGFESVWMMQADTLVRVDPADNSVIDIKIPGAQGLYRGMAVGEGGAWVPDTGTDTITKIDPTTNSVVLTIPVEMFGSEGSVGLGEGSLWVATVGDGKSLLLRYDSATGAEQARISMPLGDGVTVAFGSVWVTSELKHQLYRIDAATNELVATINTGAGPVFITAGFGSIWVIELRDGVVQRIDPETNAVIATIATGGHKGGDIITGGGYVWATFHDGLPLVQIHPKTNQAQIYAGTGFGDALAFGAGSIWISGRTIARISPPTWH